MGPNKASTGRMPSITSLTRVFIKDRPGTIARIQQMGDERRSVLASRLAEFRDEFALPPPHDDGTYTRLGKSLHELLGEIDCHLRLQSTGSETVSQAT